MNRKKIKYFGLILLLLGLFTLTPFSVMANGGSNAGETGGYGGSTCTDCSVLWGSYTARQTIRITAYVYNGSGNPIPISESKIYTNNTDLQGILNGKDSYHTNNKLADKIAYITGQATPKVVRGKMNVGYLPFDDLGSNSNAFRNWFNEILADEENRYFKQINKDIKLDESKIKSVEGYYYAVESIATAYYSGTNPRQYDFVGSAYEIAKFRDSYTDAGSYHTIGSYTAGLLFISREQDIDEYRLIGRVLYSLNPDTVAEKANQEKWSKRIQPSEILSRDGYGIGLFWKKYKNYECNIKFNSHFPIDENGKVQSVKLNSWDKDDATIATATDIANDEAVNCCFALLNTTFGNNKDALCNERPECCYDCDPGKKYSEEDATECTSSVSGYYQDAGNDKDSWYCMKAFDDYSQYLKKTITYNGVNYARVVCREGLSTSFPQQLKKQQSVGSYMVWPYPTSMSKTTEYGLKMNGTMTCKLSIDKAEIEASNNANSIYQYIYNQAKIYVNSDEAASWYKLNSNAKFSLTYNDDEYGGTNVNLVIDEVKTDVNLADNGSNKWYEKLNSLTITIEKDLTYKLTDDAYKKLTTVGIGSNNLNNMFDEINKNQFVIPQFGYGILPISYTAKVSRNISNNAIDYYKLTLKYSGLGDASQFVNQEKEYTCPYEVTFAPPTNTDDNDDGEDTHDDNNEAYEKYDEGECVCPEGTTHCSMDLRGYLIKNSKMTCAQAQAIYCNSDRGNMNVEYRVISLTEPFPGSGETAKTMALGGRDIGYNWRDSVDQTTSGAIVNTFILNNRRVTGYEVYNLEPLYVIELDSAKIKAIREYNKTTTYADFNLNCVNDKDGTICTSPFLDQYVSSGTCHTAHTKDKYFDCADKDMPESEK